MHINKAFFNPKQVVHAVDWRPSIDAILCIMTLAFIMRML